MSWWGIAGLLPGVRQTRAEGRAVPNMTLTCECVGGTHRGRGGDDRKYACARDSPEEGACDAYPRVRTASAKQVRLEFRADAHAAISGASARTVLGYDPPPAAKRRARTARVDIAVGRRPPAACSPNPRKPAAAGSAYRRCCTTRPCICPPACHT